MIPAPLNIVHTRGDSYELFGRIRDRVFNSGTGLWEAGPYKDITGWVGTGHVKAVIDDASPAFSFTITIGNQTTTPGSFFARLAPAATESVTITGASLKAVYDIQFLTPAGDKFTYVSGSFTLNKDVTRT